MHNVFCIFGAFTSMYSPTYWYYISGQLRVSFRYQRFPRSLPSVKALQDGFTLSNAQAKAEFDRRNFESESAVKLNDCYRSPMSSLQVTSLVRRWCQQNLLPFILHFILELGLFTCFPLKTLLFIHWSPSRDFVCQDRLCK